MKTKDTLKLKVFESALPKEEVNELITMIESASSIEDIDHINEIFNEKAKEIPYYEAKIINMNENIIKGLKESELADEFKDAISAMEEYNKNLTDLWKKGVDPKTDMDKYKDIFIKYADKVNAILDKKTLQMKMEYAKICTTNSKTDPDEVEALKKRIDEAMDFKKKIKNSLSEMKNNVIDGVKKATESAKSKVDELKDKIADVKKNDAE